MAGIGDWYGSLFKKLTNRITILLGGYVRAIKESHVSSTWEGGILF
jgi:hypothetical protein